MSKCPADKLTRANLVERGYDVERGESYNAHTKRKKDLYGWIDYIALHPDKKGLLGIQTTSKSNLSARVRKAEGKDSYWLWLACGNDAEFHGWYKDKKGHWAVEIRYVSGNAASSLF